MGLLPLPCLARYSPQAKKTKQNVQRLLLKATLEHRLAGFARKTSVVLESGSETTLKDPTVIFPRSYMCSWRLPIDAASVQRQRRIH